MSACLLGERVRHDGSVAFCNEGALRELQDLARLVPFCPEVSGGLPIPRPPAEIVGGEGRDVLSGLAMVLRIDGEDVTTEFLCGAEKALNMVRAQGAKLAILKDGSPSCGVTYVHDGSFSGATKPGKGITATLLEQNGIRVFSEEQIGEAVEHLRAPECGGESDPRNRGLRSYPAGTLKPPERKDGSQPDRR